MMDDKLTVFTIPGDRSKMYEAELKDECRRMHRARLKIVRGIVAQHDLCLDDLVIIEDEDITAPHVVDRDFCEFDEVALAAATLQIRGHSSSISLPMTMDGTIDMFCTTVEKFLRISKTVQDILSKRAEDRVRRGHPGPLPIDKDKDLKNFLTGGAGPLSLAGPRSTHQVDEVFARVHSRAPWLRHVTERIWRHARGRAAAGVIGYSAPPMMIWGPGGTGKSELASIIAEETGCPNLEMDAGAGSASFRVTGVESGFSTRQIGEPLRLIAEHGIANPVITINEVEKAMGGVNTANGLNTSMISALFPMLEPSSAKAFRCPASGLVCDMSRINWMMTGNDIDMLPAPFLTRLEVIEVPGLSLEDYLEATEVLCPDDPEMLRAVRSFILDTHSTPGFSLRHIIRIIDRLAPSEESHFIH
ncbi:AAA family ATPase [Sulfitobacter sp. W002]|uniref:AAA family ATPase n=1 Tax=Sulfitobacter sp. W002 TaxID=2867024 RepID=UPI0021A6D338|nr:AAA family ATPase [Sulfitobacter sp. W002]UWR30968.1 AAA family ATPase [Sulfitobacter sp. W002]